MSKQREICHHLKNKCIMKRLTFHLNPVLSDKSKEVNNNRNLTRYLMPNCQMSAAMETY